MNCKGGIDLVKNFPGNPVAGCNCTRCKNLREMKGKKKDEERNNSNSSKSK
jgi:hypothetical protein